MGVAHHYEMFGGVSPINQQNRELIAASGEEWARTARRCRSTGAIATGIRAGRDAEQMARRVQNALAFVTSAYSSYSSCRQYQQNIATRSRRLGHGAARREVARVLQPSACSSKRTSIDRRRVKPLEAGRSLFSRRTVFPNRWLRSCDYAAQLEETGTFDRGASGTTAGSRVPESQWAAVATMARSGHWRLLARTESVMA
jgi:ferrochelatase